MTRGTSILGIIWVGGKGQGNDAQPMLHVEGGTDCCVDSQGGDKKEGLSDDNHRARS